MISEHGEIVTQQSMKIACQRGERAQKIEVCCKSLGSHRKIRGSRVFGPNRIVRGIQGGQVRTRSAWGYQSTVGGRLGCPHVVERLQQTADRGREHSELSIRIQLREYNIIID